MQRHIKDIRWSLGENSLKTMNPEAFSGPNRISKMELFAKSEYVSGSVNYFRKKLHLR